MDQAPARWLRTRPSRCSSDGESMAGGLCVGQISCAAGEWWSPVRVSASCDMSCICCAPAQEVQWALAVRESLHADLWLCPPPPRVRAEQQTAFAGLLVASRRPRGGGDASVSAGVPKHATGSEFACSIARGSDGAVPIVGFHRAAAGRRGEVGVSNQPAQSCREVGKGGSLMPLASKGSASSLQSSLLPCGSRLWNRASETSAPRFTTLALHASPTCPSMVS